ncbi:MAPEG family protein [Asticcacaulis sp. 201]|uniref:MAPEG family protein n=1 Tax=Asticcacaulis sp. 201 TaxID=3028787 RepID=UPI002915F1F9|nr:MAPEG family protein [Asticcacaulis sp. 201]MDV6329542.1 MAPEG family protein [Asticcacaulis sp. 201]
MTHELWILVLAAVLGIIQVGLPPIAAMSRKGYAQWNAGPRDTPFDTGPMAGRLNRAFSNFMETFAFFAVVVIALAFAGKSSDISMWGARMYLAARVVYIPLYAFGVTGVRSLVWIISLIGILMCLYTLFT